MQVLLLGCAPRLFFIVKSRTLPAAVLPFGRQRPCPQTKLSYYLSFSGVNLCSIENLYGISVAAPGCTVSQLQLVWDNCASTRIHSFPRSNSIFPFIKLRNAPISQTHLGSLCVYRSAQCPTVSLPSTLS